MVDRLRLTEEKKQQVLTLGRLGWSLRRIEKQTGVCRETAANYLKAAGIPLRPPGAWGKRAPPKPANEVTTDSGPHSPTEQTPKPANTVTTGPAASASACQPYHEFIEQALLAGRNAKLVSRSAGFVSATGAIVSGGRADRGAVWITYVPRPRTIAAPTSIAAVPAAGEELSTGAKSGDFIWYRDSASSAPSRCPRYRLSR